MSHNSEMVGRKITGMSISRNDGDSSMEVSDLTGIPAALHWAKDGKVAGTFNLIDMPFYGRENETRLLQSALERISMTDSCSEVIILKGSSGVGKSHLVQQALRTATVSREGYFVEGKFEILRQHEPYSALQSALADLCDLLLQQPQHELEETHSRLVESFEESEIRMLSSLATGFCQLTKVQLDAQQYHHYGTALMRFKSLCKRMVRTLAIEQHPIVLFLDDLQWCDGSSLGIIESLICDAESKHILFVFAFRTDDPMSAELERFFSKKREKCLSIDDVVVGELTEESLNDMISDLLKARQDECLELTHLIQRKTHGNVYHVIQFWEHLLEEEMLWYENNSWKYDLDQIQSETNISDNVLELVSARLCRTPKMLRDVLFFAACLGFDFHVGLLHTVLLKLNVLQEYVGEVTVAEDEERPMTHKQFLAKMLKTALDLSLIEHGAVDHFKFSHDRVHNASYDMVPYSSAESRESIHLKIGRILEEVRGDYDEQLTFEIVDQQNRGVAEVNTDEARMTLARLNVEAAKLAASKSAFEGSAEYLRRAVDLIDGSGGEALLRSGPSSMYDRRRNDDFDRYDLALDIYKELAQMEFISGNFTAARRAIDTVIHNTFNLVDQIKVYHILIEMHGAQGNYLEGIRLGLQVTRELGLLFPRRPTIGHLVVSYVRMKIRVRRKRDSYFLSLLRNTDDNVAEIIHILGSVSTYAQHAEETAYFGLAVLRMMELTLKHGISLFSPVSFAGFAVLLSVLGDTGYSYRMGQIALNLIQDDYFIPVKAKVLVIVHMLSHHLRSELHTNEGPLLQAYKSGLEMGDVTWGMYGGLGHVNIRFFLSTGTFSALIADAVRYMAEMEEFKQENELLLLQLYTQSFDNIAHRFENALDLNGDYMIQSEWEAKARATNNIWAITGSQFCKIYLALFFNDWRTAAVNIDLLKNRGKTNNSHVGIFFLHFAQAMTHLLLSRTSRRALRLLQARRLKQSLEKSDREGVPICKQYVLFLQTEVAVSKQRKSVPVSAIRSMYDATFRACQQSKFLLLAAYAKERCALYLRDKDDDVRYRRYVKDAHDIYVAIGSFAKVEDVQDNFSDVFCDEANDVVVPGYVTQ